MDFRAMRSSFNIRRSLRLYSDLGSYRPNFRILRYVAARHQYRHYDRHLLDGFSDPKYPEPRHVSAAS